MSAALATSLRRVCGHDSRSVDGCLTCEAADFVEAADALFAADIRYDDAQFGLARARYNSEPLEAWIKNCAEADLRRAAALARVGGAA